jgi:hypothetical protein
MRRNAGFMSRGTTGMPMLIEDILDAAVFLYERCAGR